MGPTTLVLSANGLELRVSLSVPILIFPADVGFVYFNDAHQLAEFWLGQARTQTVRDTPRCTAAARTNHPVNLQGAHDILAGQHQGEHAEPRQQRVVDVLENRADLESENR